MEEKIGIISVVIAVIAIILAGVAVGLNREPGPKGEDGYTPIKGVDYFNGKDGINGTDGRDGTDVPINQPPSISLVYLTGDYAGIIPVIFNYCKYTYGITFKIDDPEDETTRATVYFSENSTGIWIEIGSFFGIDGKFSILKNFKYCVPQGKKTIYWLIEAWDGSDVATKVYSYTISP